MTEETRTEEGLLDDELRALRDGFAERAPQMIETVEAAIAEIEAATIGQALDVGATAPGFTLRDVTHDRDASLREALAAGPAVLSFYRGEW